MNEPLDDFKAQQQNLNTCIFRIWEKDIWLKASILKIKRFQKILPKKNILIIKQFYVVAVCCSCLLYLWPLQFAYIKTYIFKLPPVNENLVQ